MANYDKLKVTELRELLQERNLAQTGNKPDLIKRLQENDAEKEAGGAAGDAAPAAAPTAAEDEIDYEDDDVVPAAPAAVSTTTAPVAASAPLTTSAPDASSADPIAATDAISATGPTTDGSSSKSALDANPETSVIDADATPAVPAAPLFTQNLAPTDPKTEAEKRAARAAKFGVVTSDPESADAKKANRVMKFGPGEEVAKMLDSALPEKREKRKRGGEAEAAGEPGAKRATPGPEGKNGSAAAAGGNRERGNGRRRNGRGGGGGGAAAAGKGGGGDAPKKQEGGAKPAAQNQDPEWKAKLEARAKRFAAENK